MEPTREWEILIATEGLRLAQACKMPRFRSSTASGHMVPQWKKEWSKRLSLVLPPLLGWIEQHRQPLFDGEWGPGPAVQEFQKCFLLVYLEHDGCFECLPRGCASRLYKFSKDVERILTGNTVLRSWLFHYYGTELGLHGWLCRPGDLYGFYRLCNLLDDHNLDVLYGQQMLSFSEDIGKELMSFPHNQEYQKIGIELMAIVMKISYVRQNFTTDVDKILRMALRLNEDRQLNEEVDYSLWNIIYYCVRSIRNVENGPNSSLDDEVMLYLLAHLKQHIKDREDDPDHSLDNGPLAYLRTVTLMLLLDVPEVDAKDLHFDDLSIFGSVCWRDEGKFRQHVKSHLREADNLRVSIRMRVRIAKMIPRLFFAFTSNYYVDNQAYECLDLLAWMTLFPASKTRQPNNARAIMLEDLMEEVWTLLVTFITDPSQYSYHLEEVRMLNWNIPPLLSLVREGIQELPDAGWFRRFKCDMEGCLAVFDPRLEQLNSYIQQREQEEEQ